MLIAFFLLAAVGAYALVATAMAPQITIADSRYTDTWPADGEVTLGEEA